jgi:Holliday junction resolvase-like predicted endonuclease
MRIKSSNTSDGKDARMKVKRSLTYFKVPRACPWVSTVALNYLKEKQLEDVKARFDVVAILLEQKGEEIELIKDAFDLNWG